MTISEMYEGGLATTSIEPLNNTQLAHAIKCNELVISYLSGRNDANIVLTRIRSDLNMLRGFRDARREVSSTRGNIPKDGMVVSIYSHCYQI